MTVRLDRRGAVLIVALDRPERRNAVDAAMANAIEESLDELETDPSLRVAVLTGTADVFCAGTDLHEPQSPATARGGEYGIIRRPRTKPLIAAIEGPAIGGGFEIALACDLLVAARDAYFALPEVKRGVVASCGALFRGPSKLPHNVAVELLLTGDRLSADDARAYGIVNVLADPGRAVEAAVELAERIVANSPAAVAATLRAIRESSEPTEAAGWAATAAAVATVLGSPDRAEGRAAFFEKRQPNWSPVEVPSGG